MDHNEYEAAIAAVEEYQQRHGWSVAVECSIRAATIHTIAAYGDEMAKPHPRLSCLRVALKALTGALRDRMGDS